MSWLPGVIEEIWIQRGVPERDVESLSWLPKLAGVWLGLVVGPLIRGPDIMVVGVPKTSVS